MKSHLPIAPGAPTSGEPNIPPNICGSWGLKSKNLRLMSFVVSFLGRGGKAAAGGGGSGGGFGGGCCGFVFFPGGERDMQGDLCMDMGIWHFLHRLYNYRL